MPDLRQFLTLLPFDPSRLAKHLGLGGRRSVASSELDQLEYMARYANQLKCRSIAIENHYIDKDYMEDYGVFYSRSLKSYPNWCKRVHFFSATPQEVSGAISDLIRTAGTKGERQYEQSCAEFSRKNYLGFSAIKPLPGCPVGRTVLRPLPESTEDGMRRRFEVTRLYQTHLAGIELSVQGLAFQQQDEGVSACATTALWCALHKLQDFEDIASATPAQITTLATQYTLPFGRAMPSEGLSIDQMCQAVRASGLAPGLYRANNTDLARGYLHSATASGLPAVLIIDDPSSEDCHAVTVVGMKVAPKPVPRYVGAGILDNAAELQSLYVHDDRVGPYLSAELFDDSQQTLSLTLRFDPTAKRESEKWNLTHILIPLHGKIRLALAELRTLALRIANMANAYSFTVLDHQPRIRQTAGDSITIDNRILRPHDYIERLMRHRLTSPKQLMSLSTGTPLPRYLGIVRLRAQFFGTIDVLFDTTSTLRNLTCLGVIPLKPRAALTEEVVSFLAGQYECHIFD